MRRRGIGDDVYRRDFFFEVLRDDFLAAALRAFFLRVITPFFAAFLRRVVVSAPGALADVAAVGALVRLDVLERAVGVADGVELLALRAAERRAACHAEISWGGLGYRRGAFRA
jgi:hypothetical protein